MKTITMGLLTTEASPGIPSSKYESLGLRCNFPWVAIAKWLFSRCPKYFGPKVFQFWSFLLDFSQELQVQSHKLLHPSIFFVFQCWFSGSLQSHGLFSLVKYTSDLPPTQDHSGQWRFRLEIPQQETVLTNPKDFWAPTREASLFHPYFSTEM